MRRLAFAAALAGLLASAGTAAACAICLSAVSVTTTAEMDAADRVVLAVPAPGGLRVLAAMKGEEMSGALIPADALMSGPASAAGKAQLLLHNAFAGTWKPLGATAPANVGWLRAMTAATGFARLTLAAPRLLDPDALVATIAHDAIAQSTYAAMPAAAFRVDRDRLRAAIDDPPAGTRRGTLILLLGIAGDAADAAALEVRLDAARAAGAATDLAALLTADLELRGPERIGWVEATYLRDPARTVAEIEAALLALSVQGEADVTVPRETVVAAFLRFIDARPRMAGFVAHDLARWEAWEASAPFAALIAADAVSDPAAEFAILTFLADSPDPAARAALAGR